MGTKLAKIALRALAVLITMGIVFLVNQGSPSDQKATVMQLIMIAGIFLVVQVIPVFLGVDGPVFLPVGRILSSLPPLLILYRYYPETEASMCAGWFFFFMFATLGTWMELYLPEEPIRSRRPRLKKWVVVRLKDQVFAVRRARLWYFRGRGAKVVGEGADTLAETAAAASSFAKRHDLQAPSY